MESFNLPSLSKFDPKRFLLLKLIGALIGALVATGAESCPKCVLLYHRQCLLLVQLELSGPRNIKLPEIDAAPHLAADRS